jgi:hypothetical protein
MFDGAVHSFMKEVVGKKPIMLKTKERAMKRKIKLRCSGEPKLKIPTDVLIQALEKYDESSGDSDIRKHRRVAICCESSKVAKDIAKWIEDYADEISREYKTVLVIGDTAETSKKKMFEDADEAFKEAAVVIFTSTLSVGVDITDLSFGKLIMITCRTGCMLRENFQGILRFGRKVHLLDDETIVVV